MNLEKFCGTQDKASLCSTFKLISDVIKLAMLLLLQVLYFGASTCAENFIFASQVECIIPGFPGRYLDEHHAADYEKYWLLN